MRNDNARILQLVYPEVDLTGRVILNREPALFQIVSELENAVKENRRDKLLNYNISASMRNMLGREKYWPRPLQEDIAEVQDKIEEVQEDLEVVQSNIETELESVQSQSDTVQSEEKTDQSEAESDKLESKEDKLESKVDKLEANDVKLIHERINKLEESLNEKMSNHIDDLFKKIDMVISSVVTKPVQQVNPIFSTR